MISLNKANYKKISSISKNTIDIEEIANSFRKAFSSKKEAFSIFTTLKNLDTMVILHDDKEEKYARYVSFSNNESKNYLVLSAGMSIEEMRFNAACMLHRLFKQVQNQYGNFCFNFTTVTKKFSREDKYFACALLMPIDELMEFITRKDSNGKYLYLDENNEISFKNINAVADHFGMPFNQCSSRIYHVFETLRSNNKGNYHIQGCYKKRDYVNLKESYLQEQRDLDMKEVAPNHKENTSKLIKHLIDSLHYRSWDKLSEIAKHRLLVNLVKSDSVNEGVVASESEAKAIINNYLASAGTIYNGNLVTRDGEVALSDEQLVVLGEYELYTKTLERGLIKGIAKSNPRLQYLVKLDYKDAINSLKEKDLTTYICDLHRRLFSKLSYKYDEERGGMFRVAPVSLAGTNVSPASPYMIPQLMDNLSWRILDILKRNCQNELTNSEYIDQINECIYEMIRMQPFADGNKRTSRLLSNILYQEKGIPYVLVPVKEWNNYVDAWSNDDISKYNDMMHRLILESYKYFYGDQSVNDAANTKIAGEKIILANRK